MTSPLRRRIAPSVPFTLNVENDGGDKFSLSFRLAYDLNALSLAEEYLTKQLGHEVNIFAEIAKCLDVPSIRTTTVLFWAAVGLLNPDYRGEDGLEALRSCVTIKDLKDVAAACAEAFILQLPSEQAEKIRARKKAIEEGKPDPSQPNPETTTA